MSVSKEKLLELLDSNNLSKELVDQVDITNINLVNRIICELNNSIKVNEMIETIKSVQAKK